MKTKIYKTTEEDYIYYAGEVIRWLNFFCIQDFRVYTYHSKIRGALASYSIDYFGKTLGITLSTEWTYPVSKKLLSKCAFHEVAEVMLDPCKRLMHGDTDDIYESVHTVVRRLENTVFEREYDEN